MLDAGTSFTSPGGAFAYVVTGPVCRLYDREALPWPSCSLVWKGKQPSWNRIGLRFVADMATRRCPSYAVLGTDRRGHHWQAVVTDFSYRLSESERKWWFWFGPAAATPPADRPEMESRLEEGRKW